MKFLRSLITLTVGAAAFACAATAQAEDLNLGIISTDSSSVLKQRCEPLIAGYSRFAQHNTPVNSSFKAVLPSSHEANLLAVVNNKIDIATNNTEMLDTLKKQHPDKFAQVRVLWTSPLIPSDPLVWRKDLPQATKDKIRNFFVNYGKTDPHEQTVMAAIAGYAGFAASSDEQLLPIRKVALFQQKQKIESDTHLSDDDRKTQLAALDAQLGALNANTPKQ